MLQIVEERDSFLLFLIKVVNVISGALVAGHWGYRISDWVQEVWGRNRRRRAAGASEGMLGGGGMKGAHGRDD